MTQRDPRDLAGTATGAEGPGAAGEGGAPGLRAVVVPASIFLLIALFMGVDVATDVRAGASVEHLSAEVGIMVLALGGLGMMWRLLTSARRQARDLQVALDGTRADLVRWRSEAQDLLRGLGVAIDGQFDRWGLSPAEREVGILLLKGLSLKEVAETRRTSERTVRQQALAVYRKAGLAGRAELAAFFLEDLLLPRERPVAASAPRG